MSGFRDSSFGRASGIGVLCLLSSFSLAANNKDSLELFNEHELHAFSKKYENTYGYNKEIPEKYKHLFYTALAHFPSLLNTR